MVRADLLKLLENRGIMDHLILKDKVGYILNGADLSNMELNDINMSGIIFSDCDFSGCRILRTYMDANTEFNDCKFKDAIFGRVSAEGAWFSNCDFSHAYFHASELRCVKMFNCRMNSSMFSDSNINGAQFYMSDMLNMSCMGAYSNIDLSNCLNEETIRCLNRNYDEVKPYLVTTRVVMQKQSLVYAASEDDAISIVRDSVSEIDASEFKMIGTDYEPVMLKKEQINSISSEVQLIKETRDISEDKTIQGGRV